MTVEERVARGAAWLDENQPGWERRIDTGTLAIDYCLTCVLGQTFGSYSAGIDQISGGSGTRRYKRDRLMAIPFGFHWAEGHREEIELLNEAWTTLVKDRFDSGILSDHESA